VQIELKALGISPAPGHGPNRRKQERPRQRPHQDATLRANAVATLASFALTAVALAQGGPVATACKDDVPKVCVGKEHGQGEVRTCVEANKDKVSAACKAALDTTGPGKGQG